MAEVSARVKRSLEALRSAEALATLVALCDPSFLDGREAARDQAFLDLGLYFEHDFENGGPRVAGPMRIAWQRQVAAEIEAYAKTLAADASTTLGALIQKTGTNPRFFVFNSAELDEDRRRRHPVHGRAARARASTSRPARRSRRRSSRRRQQYLRVEAPDVPSVGYKVFEIQPGAGQVFTDSPTADASTGVIENEFYRLTVSPRARSRASSTSGWATAQFAGTTGGFATERSRRGQRVARGRERGPGLGDAARDELVAARAHDPHHADRGSDRAGDPERDHAELRRRRSLALQLQ